MKRTALAAPALLFGASLACAQVYQPCGTTAYPCATTPAGPPIDWHYTPGRSYIPDGIFPSTASGTGVANRIACSLGMFAQTATITSLSANIATLSAGGSFTWDIYGDTGGAPGVLLATSATGSTAATGPITVTVPSFQGQRGTPYWFCHNVDNSTAVFSPGSSAGTLGPSRYGSTSVANLVSVNANVSGLSCTGAACAGGSSTFGTHPSTLVGTTWADIVSRSAPLPILPIASVP